MEDISAWAPRVPGPSYAFTASAGSFSTHTLRRRWLLLEPWRLPEVGISFCNNCLSKLTGTVSGRIQCQMAPGRQSALPYQIPRYLDAPTP